MTIDDIKLQMAKDLLKINVDLYFKRIDQITASTKIDEIQKDAKLRAISMNEILSLAQQHDTVFREVLESEHEMPYMVDSKKKEALPDGRAAR